MIFLKFTPHKNFSSQKNIESKKNNFRAKVKIFFKKRVKIIKNIILVEKNLQKQKLDWKENKRWIKKNGAKWNRNNSTKKDDKKQRINKKI